MNSKPRILFFDIETSLSIMASFSLWPKSIPHTNIIQDWNIICASWKWQGEDTVHNAAVTDKVRQFQKDPTDDSEVVRKLAEAIENSDMIVGHNSDKFDIKKLRSRMLAHGMDPLKPVLQYDTLKVSRRLFGHTSHRLDYIAKILNVEGKMQTGKNLWMKALQGQRDAIEEMTPYCDQDVLILENVYDRLSVWDTTHPNLNMMRDEIQNDYGMCTKCGSSNTHGHGHYYTRVTKKQVFKCMDCGKYSSFKANEKAMQMR